LTVASRWEEEGKTLSRVAPQSRGDKKPRWKPKTRHLTVEKGSTKKAVNRGDRRRRIAAKKRNSDDPAEHKKTSKSFFLLNKSGGEELTKFGDRGNDAPKKKEDYKRRGKTETIVFQ